MRAAKRLTPGFTIYTIFMLAAYLAFSVPALAQDKTLDFFGPINDAEHPAGYREFVEMGCWQCHGFQGQGASGPALTPPLPYEAFDVLVRQPVNVMPAYSFAQLSEAELKSIYNYLQNVAPAPDISDIPLLSGGR
jgi:mono/diheme cytochrome c family protein